MWTGIEILYTLQDIRQSCPFLEDLFLAASSRVFYLAAPIIIAAAFFWMGDKKQGDILGLSCISAMVFSQCMKYGIAQPRPWEIDPRIVEVPGAHAHGHSLPSGHTAMVVSSFIPAGKFCGNKLVAAVLILLTVIIIMARLFLCVHTPLDILVGIAIGAAAIVIAYLSMQWAYDDDRRYYMVNGVYTAFFTVIFAVSSIYWGVPMELTLGYAGFFYGMIFGKILERLYVGYEVPELDMKRQALLVSLGVIIDAAILLVPYFLLPTYGMMTGGFLFMFWIFLIYPKLLRDRLIDWSFTISA